MQAGRTREIFSLRVVIPTILSGTIISTLLFFFYRQKFTQKLQVIRRDQTIESIFGQGSTFTVTLPEKG